ncbi:hypothetical protein CCZ01_08035 [Helicobacter monodelphidis]|uniref:DUF4149 domain-containing protein n=1 Tax=Helicobacter sp. 15-1451 TaxID=2004995 RepID=UPI000DCB0123|nr:DUF4149 domain-containing protein [Helicobacter sp. 15-1451]RAX56880.1 hypothetical protein CCZ01_08035 [Helicobacter sp. 15-1451]
MPISSHFLHRFIFGIYILTLGVGCGVILALGIFVAPVIFRATNYLLGLQMSQFQSGLIMTEIFFRSGYLLLFVVAFIIIYEFFSYIFLTTKKIYILLGGIATIMLLLFVLYYIPAIIEMQQQGEQLTQSDIFKSMHQQSVWVFQIAFLALAGLIMARINALFYK